MAFKKLIGIWILFVIIFAVGLITHQSVPAKQQTAVEKCANGLLRLDRSLGILSAFELCEDPAHSFEAWMAYKQAERASRAIPVEIIR